jgi:hypothetical protein
MNKSNLLLILNTLFLPLRKKKRNLLSTKRRSRKPSLVFIKTQLKVLLKTLNQKREWSKSPTNILWKIIKLTVLGKEATSSLEKQKIHRKNKRLNKEIWIEVKLISTLNKCKNNQPHQRTIKKYQNRALMINS